MNLSEIFIIKYIMLSIYITRVKAFKTLSIKLVNKSTFLYYILNQGFMSKQKQPDKAEKKEVKALTAKVSL